MDFKQLEVFVSVAKNKSFSKAAKTLFLTQPTVSSHIQKLENELSTSLFNRNGKFVTLTPSGKILYDNAIIILNNCKKALYDLDEYSGKIEGCIHIATSSIPETYILPSFIKYFNSLYPEVSFDISCYNSQGAINEILDDKIDFGFVGSKPNNNYIENIALVDDELVLITSYDTDLDCNDKFIDISILKNLDFIMRKDGSGTKSSIISALKSFDINIDDLKIIAHVESNESIKEMVRLGLGVSFVSYSSIIDYVDTNKLKFYRINNVDFNRHFYFIYSKKKIFSPLEEKFLSLIVDYFKN